MEQTHQPARRLREERRGTRRNWVCSIAWVEKSHDLVACAVLAKSAASAPDREDETSDAGGEAKLEAVWDQRPIF